MITATYINATTFEVAGDQTAAFHVGRRVKHVGDTTGYGTITSVSVPVADTQVVLTAASDDMDNTLSGVFYGIVSSYESQSSVPMHTHDGDEGSGGNIFSAPTFTGQATIPTINLTGGQIAFPATAVPSADPNTLDDYEEGDWTIIYGGTAGAEGATAYAENTGVYTKKGREVSTQGVLVLTNNGDWTSEVMITGLPFVAIGAVKGISQGALRLNNVTYDGQCTIQNQQGSTVLKVEISKTATGESFLDCASVPDNGIFVFQLTYQI